MGIRATTDRLLSKLAATGSLKPNPQAGSPSVAARPSVLASGQSLGSRLLNDAAGSLASPAEFAKYEDLASKLSGPAREALERLLAKGTLTKDVLDQFSCLTTEGLRKGVDRQALLNQAVTAIADPSSIQQGPTHTCGAAIVETMLAGRKPAEFLRILAGLASPQGQVTLTDGAKLTLPQTWERSKVPGAVNRLLQTAFMNFAAGGYNAATDQRAQGQQGLYDSEEAYLESNVLDKGITKVTGPAAQLMSGIAKQANSGEPVDVLIDNGAGSGHYVAVTSTKNGQVSFIDPQDGQTRVMSARDFQKLILAANLETKSSANVSRQRPTDQQGPLGGWNPFAAIGDFVSQNIVKPVAQAAQAVNEHVVQPAAHFVEDHVVKPVTQATQWISKNVSPGGSAAGAIVGGLIGGPLGACIGAALFGLLARPTTRLINDVFLRASYKETDDTEAAKKADSKKDKSQGTVNDALAKWWQDHADSAMLPPSSLGAPDAQSPIDHALDLARLCNHNYGWGPHGETYFDSKGPGVNVPMGVSENYVHLVKGTDQDPNFGNDGFHADAWQAPDGHIVIAFRGTQGANGIVTDLAQGLGIPTQQYQEALRFVRDMQKKFAGRFIELTGDSLGGSLALLASAATGLRATVFNAAAVNPLTYAEFGVSASNAKSVDYEVKGQVLEAENAIGLKVAGKIVYLDPSPQDAGNQGDPFASIYDHIPPAVITALAYRKEHGGEPSVPSSTLASDLSQFGPRASSEPIFMPGLPPWTQPESVIRQVITDPRQREL